MHLCRLTALSVLWTVLTPLSAAQTTRFNPTNSNSAAESLLRYTSAQAEECKQAITGPIETTTCDYESVDSVNENLFGRLRDLVRTPFFKYFRVDLYRDCPFWQDNGFCANRECGITTVDESEIPEKWRAATLSKVELPSQGQRNALPGCYYRDSDFCFLDDMTEGDYVDLTLNPERFTGYAGPSAHRVWKSIYDENCFGLSEFNLMSAPSPAPVTLPEGTLDGLSDDGGDAGECLEKRVYYKIISGLHASISTHVCFDHLDQLTGKWGPNLQCFIDRVASHPERLQYVYFNTVLLLRAVSRLGPYLSAYDYCSSGTHEEDAETHAKLGHVIDIATRVGRFDEGVLFRGENAQVLKDEFKSHFRNVSRIMDCVGCDKCRLWGKVQTSGLGTALKVLFELDEKALDPRANANLLQRSEVVALINTLHRFVETLHAVDTFRSLWAISDEKQNNRKADPENSRQPSPESRSWIDEMRWRMEAAFFICRDSVVSCVALLRDFGKTIRSAMSLSGKDGIPSMDEL